ncbi:MAG: amino acid adenylation domain-containing protein [Candidatus Marithrix sp.]
MLLYTIANLPVTQNLPEQISMISYPLSSPQREIWLEQMFYPDIPLYNIGGYAHIKGSVDPVIFEKALQQVIQQNDTLRIIIQAGQELPTQTFLEQVDFKLNFQDFSVKNNPHQDAIDWMKQEFFQSFQLYDELLFQFALCKIADNCYYWFNKYHHIITDGWGIALTVQRVATRYNSIDKVQKSYPYLNFVKDDVEYLNSPKFTQHQQYWQKKCANLPEPFLIHRHINQQLKNISSQCSTLLIKRTFYNQILAFAKTHNVSIFNVILGVFYCYFVRAYNQDNFSIFLPTLNRKNVNFKKTIGMFATASPAWFRFGTDLSFTKLIQLISKELKQDYKNQRFPFYKIKQIVGLHAKDRKQLFDIQLSYEKHDYEVYFNDSPVEAIPFLHDFDQKALAIFIREFYANQDVKIDFSYNLAVFDAEEIEFIKSRFEFLLTEVILKPEIPIRELQIMSDVELNKILVEFNNTTINYPNDKTIVDLFEKQVAKTPENIAVIFEEQKLTYKELNNKSNQLSHHLQTLGIKSEVLVGICVERSLEMIIGLLGILKAGGAYLPLDPTYPTERLTFMLEDAQVPVLLTQSKIKLPKIQAQVVYLDEEKLSQYSSENVISRVKPENLAYVIYTSGSTGRPKGVQITHSSLINFLISMRQQPGISSDDVLLAVTTLSFDIAALEIYLPLIVGARIVLVNSEGASDGLKLLDKLDDITIMQATPATWRLLINNDWKDSPKLKILCGGEALSGELATQILEKSQTLWNVYGPTETTIWSTIIQLTKVGSNINSIGKPIANTKIYILDKYLHPVPIGVSGELHIGGAGLARGYLNRPELTAEKFIKNPFSEDPTSRIYKTGDLARYLPDGNIEYLGRIDNQVKIRGFRIELGEIESVLGQHHNILEVAVIAKTEPSGNKCLKAYIISNLSLERIPYQSDCLVAIENNIFNLTTKDISYNGVSIVGKCFSKKETLRFKLPDRTDWVTGQAIWCKDKQTGIQLQLNATEQSTFKKICDELDKEQGLSAALQRTLAGDIRQYLQKKLPSYMIPSAFIILDTMPLTPNGKVDRQVLSKLSEDEYQQSTKTFTPPRTQEEELLANIWMEVLGVKQVGIHDDFFELGGHSLLATQVMSRIRDTFNIELPLRELFITTTIAELSKRLSHQLTSLPPIEPVNRSEPLQLSFAQQRLWILNQLEGISATYNMVAALRIEGVLNQNILKQSLQTLVQRHENLRAIFITIDSKPIIKLINIEHQLPIISLRNLSSSEVEILINQEAQKPFNLETGPLFRTQLLCLDTDLHILLVNMHHIISDGWSVGVLIRDWKIIYEALVQNKAIPLPTLPIQYVDYANWQRQQLTKEVFEQQINYWQQQLANIPALLELPTDKKRPPIQSFKGSSLPFTLSAELTLSLKQLSQRTGTTLFMTLWSAFAVLLSRYSGQDDIVIGSPIANRTRSEIESIVGFFVNTLVLRLDLSDNPSFETVLQQAQKTALGAYSNQDVPFEKLVEILQPERNLNHTPLFQVMFVLQNVVIPELDLIGLRLTHMEVKNVVAKFDLSLSLEETASGLSGTLEYNTDLFEHTTIERLSGHLHTLLVGIVESSKALIHELPLLTNVEQQQLLLWNDTKTDYPHDKTIIDLFEEQVAKTPENIAVVFEEQQLTYAELNNKSNRLAHYLQTLGVKPEVLVGICVERSLEMLIGLLGILKAGGAYLPLDPTYPTERLAFMLEDAQVPVLLSQSKIKLPQIQAQVVYLDKEKLSQYSYENVISGVKPENLAYVIYTSGSTGRPKGIAMQQNSLVNLIHWQHSAINTLQFASINFDVSFQEIFSTWYSGGNLILVTEEIRKDNKTLITFLKQHEISRLFVPFVALQDFAVAYKDSKCLLNHLYEIITAGEQLQITPSISSLFKKLNLCILSNHYGPSESHVVTFFNLDKLVDNWPELPSIGKPIANTKIYILDKYLQSVPIGVTGELHIGGVGLARGYLNRPELTAEKFIQNPFSEDPTSRIYKTGDLARYLPNGNIEYLGRIDNQVKIRGFRIELGEIESVLGQHHNILEVAVIAESSGNKRLKAYFVSDLKIDRIPHQSECLVKVGQEIFHLQTNDLSYHGISLSGMTFNQDTVIQIKLFNQTNWLLGKVKWNRDGQVGIRLQLSTMEQATFKNICDKLAQEKGLLSMLQRTLASSMRKFLQKKLPNYMIPSAFIILDALPLTPNGKIDRKALESLEEDYQPIALAMPQTVDEKLLADIWSKILGLKQVGIHDNFFEIGGHSLLATQLIAELCESFKVQIPLRELFAFPTIAGMIEVIDRMRNSGTETIINLDAEAVLDPSIQPAKLPSTNSVNSIFLTGTTGFLGSYLLYELLVQTTANIYCLVRSTDKNILVNKLKANMSWDESFKTRIILVQGDLSKPLLGLEKEYFEQLANKIDVIYHNGAWVNHIFPYSVLKTTNVLGTEEILRLASKHKPKPVHFISTINTIDSSTSGYTQSKIVAEKIIQLASERGLPVCIYRPPVIAGHSKTGIFNRGDTFSSIIKGCIQLGEIPIMEDIGLNMLPVDYVSNVIIKLSLQQHSRISFNLINPNFTSWNKLFDKLVKLGYKLKKVSYAQWKEELSFQQGNALYPLLSSLPKDEDSFVKPNLPDKYKAEEFVDDNWSIKDDELLDTYFAYFLESGFFDRPIS